MLKRSLLYFVFFTMILSAHLFAQDISWMDSYRISVLQAHQDKPYSGPGFGNKNGTYYGVYSVGEYYAGFGVGHKFDVGFYGKANCGMSYSLDSEVGTADKFGLNYGGGFGLATSYNKELDEQAALKVFYFADLDRIGMQGLAFQPAVRYGSFLVETTIAKAVGESKTNKVALTDFSVTYLTKHYGWGVRIDSRSAENAPLPTKVNVSQIHLVFMMH